MLKLLRRVEIWMAVLAGLCLAQLCYAQGSAQGQAPGRTRSKGRSGATTHADPNAPKEVYPTSRGVLKSIAGSQLLVQVDDEHEMKFRMTHKTKIYTQVKDGQGKNAAKEIKASSLEPGQTVDVDMQTSLDGAFEAVHVTVVSPKVEPPK